MIIQHNIMALNSYNKLATNNSAVQKNLEKLSSGYRINRAGDDAAGLAISEKMRAQITGLERAKLNAQDGISLVQTAEGALTEVHSMLNRLVELGTESANGIYQADDRQKIQDEVSQILEEVDRISLATNFNGINLLDGSLAEKATVSANAGDYVQIDGGTLEHELKKNQTVVEATNSSFTIDMATAAGGFSTGNTVLSDGKTKAEDGYAKFDVRYIDEAGVERTQTITVKQGANAQSTLANIGEKLTDLGFANASVSGNKLNVESATAGSNGAQLLGITQTQKDMTSELANDGTKIKEENQVETKVQDADKEIGIDKQTTNFVEFKRDFKIGDKITIGDKTYEIADEAAINNVGEGNIGVVFGTNKDGAAENERTMRNLVNALIANGVDARVVTEDKDGNPVAKTLGIDNLKQISVKKETIQTSVNSNDITVGDSNSTKGVWSFQGASASTGVQNVNLTVKYLDENGVEKSRTIQYTTGADSAANANNIKAALVGDEVLNKLFKAELFAPTSGSAAQSGVRMTAVTSGSKGAQLLSVVATPMSSTSGANAGISSTSFRQEAQGIDGGKGFKIGNNVAEGDTVTVAGKNFQFVTEENVSKVEKGTVAVVIGDSAKDTAKNFNEALKDAGFDTFYEEGATGVRVIANDKSLNQDVAGKEGGLTLQVGDTADDFNKVTVYVDDMSSKGLGIDDLDVTEQGLSSESIEKVKAAIEKVSTNRGRLGALQNRLEHTINNLATTTENMTAAESRIRDTDMAKEMMAFTKNNVLVQAAQSMLAQANQQPQQVLQLLR